MTRRPRTLGATILGAALAIPAAAGAQLVRGVVVDSATRRPIEEASVALLAADGALVAGDLTDADGRYTLRAPAAGGAFRLRVRRLGYRGPPPAPLAVAPGEVARRDVALAAAPSSLAAIRAESPRRCAAAPPPGAPAAALLEVIRAALDATAVGQRAGRARMTVRDHERELDPATLAVRAERSRERTGVTASPYESPPPESLSAAGYVQRRGETTWYYAPVADALASDAFARDHCVHVVRDGAPSPGPTGLVGLAFEPVRGRRLPDVRGTVWVDGATAELRAVDFAYTGLPAWARTLPLGGRLELARVPGAGWVVRRWVVRAPRLGRVERSAVSGALAGGRVVTRAEEGVVALVETGGEVLHVEAAARGAPEHVGRGTVRGTVWDSLAGRPLAAARVEVEGTTAAALTDARGAFEIAGVSAGRQRVRFSHPGAVAIVAMPAVPVEVVADSGARVALFVPSAAATAAALCPDRAAVRDTVALYGVVRRAEDGMPAPGATVAIAWTGYVRSGIERLRAMPVTVRAVADSLGAYHVCGVPSGVELRARAESGATTTLVVRTPALARLDLWAPMR